VFQPAKRQYESQGYRAGRPDQTDSTGSMQVLIGAAMIATAILLSTLITALSSRYVGMESPTEESAWLIDRLTGHVYRCEAATRGRASCDAEIATSSVEDRSKR
jgi:hypothetical protein